MTDAGRPPRRSKVQLIRDRAQELFEAEREQHEGLLGNASALDRAYLFADGTNGLVEIGYDRMSSYYDRALKELSSEGVLNVIDLGPEEDCG